MGETSPEKPDRNLALELVRVTEAAALAAARWVGRGDKIAADQAAVDAMRFVLDSVSMDGVVVIGEGEKDEAPMLYNGEQIGDGTPPVVDIAVDPLEGTRLCALGMPSALAVIALAERGTMFDPGPCVYMEKLAGGEEIADLLDLDRPLPETLKLIAERKGGTVGDVTVVMLDRPRHEEAMREVREAGGRIRLITDGDVSAALLAVSDRSPVDLLWGIGGTPEGVLSAAALKSMGGQLLGRLWPRDDGSARRRVDAGYDLDRVLTADDLCSGDDVFFSASGVTDGDVLQGVRYRGPGASTESLVMRSRSGTVRRVQARHDRAKLRAIMRRALRLMDVGIALPNAVPGATGEQLTEWARRAEARGFSSLGTIDRVRYDNYEPLIALAAAAAVTERIGSGDHGAARPAARQYGRACQAGAQRAGALRRSLHPRYRPRRPRGRLRDQRRRDAQPRQAP